MWIKGMNVSPAALRAIYQAQTIAQLVQAARIILAQMDEPQIVIGPMTTGGKGNLDDNLRYHDAAVTIGQHYGWPIFHQGLFRESLARIIPGFQEAQQTDLGRIATRREIVTGFFRPLFEEEAISQLLCLPDWQSSVGATMEVRLAYGLGRPLVQDFPRSWITGVEQKYQQMLVGLVS